jgi:ribosomal protein L11 methyltransferase
MKKALWEISVTARRECEEALGELLERIFGSPSVIYARAEEAVSTVTVYSQKGRGHVLAQRQALEEGLAVLVTRSSDLMSVRITMRPVAREDWSYSWKKHFHPIEIGPALLIKPSWVKRRPTKGQALVVLDPGLSFGTGQHPTTCFCLEQLVEWRKTGQSQSFLDIGTGSGILAIAACKLGYNPVRALDNDPSAIRVAETNARRNRVRHRLVLACEDLTNLRSEGLAKYHIVCANLLADVLVDQAKRLTHCVRSDGNLVLAGILAVEFSKVERVFDRLGWRVRASSQGAGWHSAAFARRADSGWKSMS